MIITNKLKLLYQKDPSKKYFILPNKEWEKYADECIKTNPNISTDLKIKLTSKPITNPEWRKAKEIPALHFRGVPVIKQSDSKEMECCR